MPRHEHRSGDPHTPLRSLLGCQLHKHETVQHNFPQTSMATLSSKTHASMTTPMQTNQPSTTTTSKYTRALLHVFLAIVALYSLGKALFLASIVRWLLAQPNPERAVYRVFSIKQTPENTIIDGFGLTHYGYLGATYAAIHAAILVTASVALFSTRKHLKRIALTLLAASTMLWAANGTYLILQSDFKVFGWATGGHFAMLTFIAALAINAYRQQAPPTTKGTK